MPRKREPRRWHLLIHQLPPRPLYLRAKVRRRLAKVGALAVKNSVYVLPAQNDCLEDFQWIAEEAVAGGGEASICTGQFLHGLSDDALVERFQRQAAAQYGPLAKTLSEELRRLRTRRPQTRRTSLLTLRKRLRDVTRIDFFDAELGKQVEALMRAIDRAGRTGRPTPASASSDAIDDLVGRVWVTRGDPYVDRLASAWLIRRFIDPAARFRFVAPTGGPTRGTELSFDMVGADFTHDGDRCTFETMLARLALDDRGLRELAEVVHDIDLKDAKFGRPDAAGVEQLLRGLVETHRDSGARLEAGLALFDALYASFGGRATPRPRNARATKARRRQT